MENIRYREIAPADALQRFVKCYYIYESDSSAVFEDVVFPSGCMEIIFNLGSGSWQTGDDYITTPPVELWGQLLKPLPVRSVGKNTMLGVRLFPHAAAFFLKDEVEQFNSQVVDFRDVWGNAVRELHALLQESAQWERRIELVQNFLLHRLATAEKKWKKIAVVHDIMNEIRRNDFYENIHSLALQYGISSRYLQKLFLRYTGLTPKFYTQINRFQNSLRLVAKKDRSLTSIAYDCGYFDQSHFIKEFKYFTGTTPSGYSLSPVTSAFAEN